MNPRLSSAPALLLVTACGAAEPQRTASHEPTAQPTTRSLPSAAPAPSAARPTDQPAPAAMKLAAERDSQMALAVDCSSMFLSFYELESGLLGLCGVRVAGSAAFFIGKDGTLRPAPEAFRDLPAANSAYGISDVSGTDVDNFDASLFELHTRTGTYVDYRKRNKKWSRGRPGYFGSSFDGSPIVSLTIDGRTVTHAYGDLRENHQIPEFQYADRKPGWLPKTGTPPGCDKPVEQFAAFHTDGKVLWGLGTACGKLVTQRWVVGTDETSLQTLDVAAKAPLTAGHIVAVGTRPMFEAFPQGAAMIHAHFDGQRWRPLRFAKDVRSNVSQYVLHKGDTYFWGEGLGRLDGDAVVSVPVPDGDVRDVAASPSELRILTKQGLFALGDGAWHPLRIDLDGASLKDASLHWLNGRFVLRTQAYAPERIRLFVETIQGAALRLDDSAPATSPLAFVRPLAKGCEQPFAFLYQLQKTAPADFDYPATKAALEGQPDLLRAKFSELGALGQRYLIARFEGADAPARLARLVKRLEAEVKGSKPQLLCADDVPGGLPVAREISMQ